MAVLPASRRIDIEAQKNTERRGRAIASEQEFGPVPKAEIGLPPSATFTTSRHADTSLTTDNHITFNAGTHYKAVRMHYRDFERLVRPRVACFSVHL
jgi:Ala-tRNA(Pro) deacylase